VDYGKDLESGSLSSSRQSKKEGIFGKFPIAGGLSKLPDTNSHLKLIK